MSRGAHSQTLNIPMIQKSVLYINISILSLDFLICFKQRIKNNFYWIVKNVLQQGEM